MWWDLSIHTSAEGLEWELRSVNIPQRPGMGIWRWRRSGSVSIPPDARTDAANVLAVALSDVLSRLGEGEHLGVRGGQAVLSAPLDVRLVVGDEPREEFVALPDP